MKTQAIVVLSSLFLWSCANTPQAPHTLPQSTAAKTVTVSLVQPGDKVQIEPAKAADIVDVLTVTSQVQVSLAYAGPHNFTGSVVPGYQANRCYLTRNTAQALAKVATQAERLGYKLQLLDCYRPQRASDYFMQWVADNAEQNTKATYYPRIDKSELTQGYIAAYSGHSRASTVDLTLLQKNAAGQWHALDMGGVYDLFDPVSHLDNTAVTSQQKANRLLLKDLMQQQGFAPYAMEWWHFSLHNETYPNSYFDFVVN